MNGYLISGLAVIFGSGVTGYFAWITAKRTATSTDRMASGSITTSTAASLWDEGTAMRGELRQEVIDLRAQIALLIPQITSLNLEIMHSRQETEAARSETRQSREETRILMAQIESLHNETSALHEEVKTGNALTIGALADNTETRRILELPIAERTIIEQAHLDTAGTRLSEEKRADQSDGEGHE